MSVIINFFLGLAILISGDEIASLLNYEYITLLCNIVGACLMAYAGKKYLDYKKEALLYEKNIQDGLTELSNKIATSSNVEELIKRLEIICNNQMKIEEFLEDTVSSADENINNITASLRSDFDHVNKNIQIISNDNKEMIVSARDEMSKKLDQEIAKLGQVIDSIDKFSIVPKALIEYSEQLSKKIESYISNTTEKIDNLTEDVSDENKKLAGNLKKQVNNLAELMESSQKEVSVHLNKLGAQYDQFEQLTKELIKQLTLMSDKDYEIMKGFLDD